MTVKLDTTKLDLLIATNPQKVADVVGKSCFRILGAARMVAPRDPARPPKDPERQVTGALKANSDVVNVDPLGLTRRVEFYQEYAVFQELGAPAINLPARPFLTPATENEVPKLVSELTEVIK